MKDIVNNNGVKITFQYLQPFVFSTNYLHLGFLFRRHQTAKDRLKPLSNLFFSPTWGFWLVEEGFVLSSFSDLRFVEVAAGLAWSKTENISSSSKPSAILKRAFLNLPQEDRLLNSIPQVAQLVKWIIKNPISLLFKSYSLLIFQYFAIMWVHFDLGKKPAIIQKYI